MRLPTHDIESILATARKVFGDDVAVWLFGLRVDDSKRGGDIDLLIRPTREDPGDPEHWWSSKLRFLRLLEQRIGERKVDVVIESPGDMRPIVQIAHETGIRL